MPIDKRHRTSSLLPQAYKLLRRGQLGSWGVGECTVSNQERWWWRCHTSTWRSAAWQSQCPWAFPDLSSHGASSQTQTPCCSALHHLKQTHNWFGLFLKKTKMSTCSVLYTSKAECTLGEDYVPCIYSHARWVTTGDSGLCCVHVTAFEF